MAELMRASSQWATRPADERFWTLRDMRMSCEMARAGSQTRMMKLSELRAEPVDGQIALVKDNPNGTQARGFFTHYAFGQVSRLIGAPGGYLRELPADLAAQCVNAGLVQAAARDDSPRNWLLHRNGRNTFRAVTSDKYDRVWDDDVCRVLEGLTGWRAPAGRVPPGYDGTSRAATVADILPGQINISEGTPIAPSGLYASDHDMFAFLVAPDRVIDDGSGKPLMRGVFVRNSEVGDASLSMTFFLMQAVCGNHIVWNATGVHEISLRHIGRDTFGRAARAFQASLRRYHDAAPEEERLIVAARNLVLGNSKEEVLDALIKYCKSHSLELSKPTLENALTVAEEHTDWYGNPRTLWSAVAGLTHASQGSTFADARNAVDKQAGKLLAMTST